MNDEILDDAGLAKRWHKDKEGVTAEAIAKWIDRLCNKKRAKHLKSFKSGKKRLFRIEDVREYESRANHFLTVLSTNGDEVETWLSLARLAELDNT